jgi:PhnB protein
MWRFAGAAKVVSPDTDGWRTMLDASNRSGFHTVTPYLMVADPDGLAGFLEAAFEAEVTYRTTGGGGGDHIEIQIGDSRIMVGGGGPVVEDRPAALFLYVDDVDGLHERAVQAGASSIMEPADRLFGEERGAGVVDPAGNQWFLGRHGPASNVPG